MREEAAMADDGTPTPGTESSNPPAAESGQTPAQPDGGGTNQQASATGEQLGDGGKRALEAEREARKAAAKQLADAQRELDRFRKAAMTEQERAIEDARASVRQELTVQFAKEKAGLALRAQAAESGADASQIELWDLGRFVGEDGSLDDKAITKAVSLLPRKRNDATSFDGGSRAPAQTTSMDDLIRTKAGVRR